MPPLVTDDFTIELDLTSQVLSLRIPPDIRWQSSRTPVKHSGPFEVAIEPVFPAADAAGFVSMAALALKAKQFDDGLYAAAELAAERGAGRFGGKRSTVLALARALAVAPPDARVGNVAEVLAAAAELSGAAGAWPPALERAVRERLNCFLRDQLQSKPLAFYSWSAGLESIFLRDRMLQTELEGREGIRRLVTALRHDTVARAKYTSWMALISRLTNPFAERGLRSCLGAGAETEVPERSVHILPPSRSRETELVKKLYGDRPIPAGFDLAEEMIRRIRGGTLDLEPTSDSGWYDHQSWALEPLVVPERMAEAKHLQLAASYTERLLELFRGVLALTRETHVKQLEVPRDLAAMPARVPTVVIHPKLSIEPLPTFYLRRALSYCFVLRVLRDAFGDDALGAIHRLTPTGAVKAPLGKEISRMQSLLFGAYATACREIGMAPGGYDHGRSDSELKADADHFRLWRSQLGEDPDLTADTRMMVPIFYDPERRKAKVWVLLGWASGPLDVSFARVPAVTVYDRHGRRLEHGGPELEFADATYRLVYPVTAEVYTGRILDRDEFRRLCDLHRTRSAILNHVEQT